MVGQAIQDNLAKINVSSNAANMWFDTSKVEILDFRPGARVQRHEVDVKLRIKTNSHMQFDGTDWKAFGLPEFQIRKIIRHPAMTPSILTPGHENY